jgi:hypothetical protein
LTGDHTMFGLPGHQQAQHQIHTTVHALTTRRRKHRYSDLGSDAGLTRT